MAAYRYFESKDELLIATCEEVFSELARMRESRAGCQEAVPIERLKDQLRTFIEFGISHPNSYKLIFMTEISNSSLSRQREAIVQKGMAGLREKVQQCADAANVEVDVSLTSQALRIGATGLVAGTIAKAISRKDEKQLITKMINLLTAEFV
jgi:AcrR family transcriptional regulator